MQKNAKQKFHFLIPLYMKLISCLGSIVLGHSGKKTIFIEIRSLHITHICIYSQTRTLVMFLF